MRTQFERWEQDVYKKWEEVDPHSTEDWHSLAYGYFIGLGLSPEDAYESVAQAQTMGLL